MLELTYSYGNQNPGENSNGTQYSTGDHLGSPRVITNASATVVSRHDYMPFGEELGAGVGGRTTGMGFSNSADNNRKKFAGYERDNETGLDFAQARYNSSTLGRFTSPDPYGGSMSTGNPPSFNRYAYVGNNPVNAIDPTGLDGDGPGGSLPGAEGAMGRLTGTNGIGPTVGVDPTETFVLSGGNQPEIQAQQQGAAVVTSGLSVAEMYRQWASGTTPDGDPVPPWLSGPIPLAPGVTPVPTGIGVITSGQNTYNGDPVVSPLGETLLPGKNYGFAITIDYIVVDQGGNPMSGVDVGEKVSTSDRALQAMINAPGSNVTSNGRVSATDSDGAIPDRVGLVGPNQQAISATQQGPPILYSVDQRITVYMPNATGKAQGVLAMDNKIVVTNNSVNILFGPLRHFH